MAKVIFHIDLNAFFANAEVLKNPSLKGKPLAVGGNGTKGVVSTASYEARAYGVHSAMSIYEARRLCPELIVVPGDYDWYEKLSHKFMHIIRTYTNIVEQASIDECYADMSEAIKRFTFPLDLANEIQNRVKNEVGVTCSIGIAPNKFLAKIGSDYKKPNGITIIRKREIESKLWPLPIDAMGGIGKKTAPLLKKAGINTIGDMANKNNEELIISILGKNAPIFISYANGNDDSIISDYWTRKSISESTTLNTTLIEYTEVKSVFSKLVRDVVERLTIERMSGNNISITIRYYDFKTITRSITLDKYVSNYEEIIANCMKLYEMNDKGKEIRLLGVAVNNLKDNTEIETIDLFNYYQHIEDTDELINSLNHEMSQNFLMRLSDITKKGSE